MWNEWAIFIGTKMAFFSNLLILQYLSSEPLAHPFFAKERWKKRTALQVLFCQTFIKKCGTGCTEVGEKDHFPFR